VFLGKNAKLTFDDVLEVVKFMTAYSE